MIRWSIFGLIFFGLGVLPLTPVLAAFCSWRIGRSTRLNAADASRFKTGWRLGALAAVVVLLTLEGPALWTRMNLSAAVAGGEKSATAITGLRAFHSDRTQVKACYEGGRGMAMATARDTRCRRRSGA